MNRRRFLVMSGSAGLAVGFAGCGNRSMNGSPTPDTESNLTRSDSESPSPTEPFVDSDTRRRFERIVNIGASPAVRRGDRSIVPLLEEHAGDDTALYLPHGTYLMDDVTELFEFTNLGIVGDSATIVPPDGYDSVLFDVGRPGTATDFLIQNIEFDMRAPDTGARALSLLAGGDVTVRNVSVVGKRDAGHNAVIRIDVTDPEGVATVERLHLPHGSEPTTSAAGCYVGEYHEGLARFVDCYINGFADNGLYASPENGSIHVEGGVFTNCAVASLRVGDNSVIRGAYVRCDSAPDGFKNMRGIRLRQGNNVLVDDCTIDMFSVNSSDGALVLAHRLEAATIRNVRIRVNPDGVPAIRIRGPRPEVPRDGPIRISDVSITGEAANGVAVEVDDRDNCQFDYAYVRQTGPNRDGFLFDECQDVLVKNTVIDVTHTPIVSREGSTIEKVNVRTSGDRWSGFDLSD